MITSMDRNELYKTLVGHSKSSHYTYFPARNNDRSVEKTTENKTAFYALGRKRYSLSPEAVAEIVKMEKNLTPMERLAAREQEIRDYAKKYCKIDRVALMKLFNNVRYKDSIN